MEAQDFVSNNQRREKTDCAVFNRRPGIFWGIILQIEQSPLTRSSLFRRFIRAISTRSTRFGSVPAATFRSAQEV